MMSKLLGLLKYRLQRRQVCENVQKRIEDMELQETEERVQKRMNEIFNQAK